MKKLFLILLLFTGYCASAQVSPVVTRDTLTANATAAPAGVTKVTLTANATSAPAGVTKATLSYDVAPIVFMYFFPFKLN